MRFLPAEALFIRSHEVPGHAPCPGPSCPICVAFRRLRWKKLDGYEEATIGDFYKGDGVRFCLTHHPTCYRRGPWRLLVEVADGPMHEAWGCFDDQDQPMRNFHKRENALSEAQALADVLLADRRKRRT